MTKQRVLFVYPKYPDGYKEVLALFPDMKEHRYTCGNSEKNWRVDLIGSYARIGQHGAACRTFMRRKRATPEQYAPLKNELESIGYNLVVINEHSNLRPERKRKK